MTCHGTSHGTPCPERPGSTTHALPIPLQSSKEQVDQPTGVVAGVVVASGAEVADAPSASGQAARRRTSQMVAAMSSTDSASSQPPSIHWKGQNRLPG